MHISSLHVLSIDKEESTQDKDKDKPKEAPKKVAKVNPFGEAKPIDEEEVRRRREVAIDGFGLYLSVAIAIEKRG